MMIEFIIKSTICLTVLYGFYYFFLQNIKIFDFNRFYLLFALLFSLIVPLINIHISVAIPVNTNLHEISNATKNIILGKEISSEPIHDITIQDISVIIYIIVSCFLLLRFVLNIFKIVRLVHTSKVVSNSIIQIILVEKEILPYSFYKYIFINRSDYENGRIDKELILHEQAHCLQYHSIDILLVELIKVFLWFNPFLWIYRKAIQLNHEFLADNKVLSNYNLYDYQNTLINLVFRNNNICLASSFNYSLTKKRLKMMVKNNSQSKVIFRKIAAIPLFLVLAITLIFSQETQKKENSTNSQVSWWANEWWMPILEKHNVKMTAFNNFKNIFEMGETNSIDNNGVCTLTNAFMIIRDSVENYMIIESPLIIHDLKNEIIKANSGTIKKFKKDSNPDEPYEVWHIVKMELYSMHN